MSAFLITGNNTINEKKVCVKIRVSKADGSKMSFGQKPKITISNIDQLLIADKCKTVQYKDDVATSYINISFNSQNKTYYTSPGLKEITYFEVIIQGNLNEAFSTNMPICITIKQNDTIEEKINFNVVKTAEPIKIKSLNVSANIIQKNKQKLDLCYEIEGNPEKISVFENGKELDNDVINIVKFKDLLKDKNPGIYEYTLQATKDKQIVSKSETVLYVDESKVATRTPPTDCTIINFCAAQNGEYLFALFATKKIEVQLYYTNQIDGDNWQSILIEDCEKIKPFVNSPMVHLQSDQEKEEGKLGRILFIGGSRIENTSYTTENGNQVAIIELNESVTQISINKIQTWQPRWGHTCVIFPKNNEKNTIWMLGGEDEYGNATNEVWTSTNGIEWSKENNASWQKRAMHDATISYKIEDTKLTKEAIFLGGGFEAIGDKFIPDIWKYESNKWKKIEYTSSEKEAKGFGIGFGGFENIGDTGIYTITSNINMIINKLIIDNNNKYSLNEINTQKINMFNQGIIITAFFKECLWFMSINSTGSSGTTYSDLFYRIPTLQQTTIDFYSNSKNK